MTCMESCAFCEHFDHWCTKAMSQRASPSAVARLNIPQGQGTGTQAAAQRLCGFGWAAHITMLPAPPLARHVL